MPESTQTKAFFGPTKELVQTDARHWSENQKDVYIPTSNTLRQSEAGGWILTVTYQIRPARKSN
jgi:hypothetical protein